MSAQTSPMNICTRSWHATCSLSSHAREADKPGAVQKSSAVERCRSSLLLTRAECTPCLHQLPQSPYQPTASSWLPARIRPESPAASAMSATWLLQWAIQLSPHTHNCLRPTHDPWRPPTAAGAQASTSEYHPGRPTCGGCPSRCTRTSTPAGLPPGALRSRCWPSPWLS